MSITSTEPSSPFNYGQILNRSLYEESLYRSTRMGIGTCVSQGFLVGAALNVFLSVFAILISSNRLVIIFLPFYFAVTMSLGIFQGLWLWVFLRFLPWRLGVLVRAILSSAGLLVFLMALQLVLLSIFPLLRLPVWLRELDIPLLVLGVAFLLCVGTVFAIIIGSTIDPWPELWNGSDRLRPPVWWASNIVGVFLRSIAICLLMESTLLLIAMVMFESPLSVLATTLLAVGHSVLCFVAAFNSFRVGILSFVALIANAPLVYLMLNLDMNASQDSCVLGCFVIAYLTLWAMFLLTRSAIVYAASKFVWAEIRYYLID